MIVREKNGIIYIHGLDEELDWCDCEYKDNGELYGWFLLNATTRIRFRDEILPLVKSRICEIDRDLLIKIRDFRQNPERAVSIPFEHTPEGITLKEHQLESLDMMFTHNKYGFFLGTGSGKTLIAITWLMNARPASALIVTPQKVVGQFKAELDKYMPNSGYEVTNYEQLHKYTNEVYEALILDESHKCKSYTSNMNENCRAIASKAVYAYLFTGTPQDKSRHEILSQLAILDQRVMPVKTRVMNRYFNIDDYYNPKSEKRSRKAELTAMINAYTWGRRTEDVITLTKENNMVVRCGHPGFYDNLIEDRVVSIDGKDFVADNKGVLRLMLREICSGCLSTKLENGSKHTIQFETDKRNELSHLIEHTGKGIIYYEFTASLKEIHECLLAKGKTFVTVNGQTASKASTELIGQFKRGDVDFLVIQSRSGNAGLDLICTNNIIFYSLPESYIVFTQCKGRIRRYGQTKECNYYYLICSDTVEELIYTTLSKKKSLTEKIFSQYLGEPYVRNKKKN